jgi:hypothetical protein
MSGREVTNVRPTGRKCPVDRAQMSGRPGANVLPSGRKCPVDRAQMSCRVRANLASSWRRCRVEGPRMSGSEAKRTYVPARGDIRARSRRHSCPLEATLRAHSRRHSCPLAGAGVGGPVAYLTLTVATLEVCPLLRSIMRTRLAPRCASSTKLWNRPEPVVTAGKGNVIHRPCLRS